MTTINPQNKPERERIWIAMLNGSLSFEAGRRLLFELEGSQEVADSLVAAAMEQRKQGLASGAAWAYPTPSGTPQETPGLLSQHSRDVLSAVDPVSRGLLGENDPLAAFLSQRGLPAYGGTPAQKWQAEQFGPQFSTWQASSALNPSDTPPQWADYLKQGEADPGAIRRQAAALFQQARGGNQLSFQSQLDDPDENRGVGPNLARLLQSALLSRFATPVARRMAGWIPDIATQYQANTAGTGDKLLDFFDERLRLR